MGIDLGVALPKLRLLAWGESTKGFCDFCGQEAPIIESKCPECHEYAFVLEISCAYESRIRDLMAEASEMRAFIRACLDCGSAEELHDFVVNNAEKVLEEVSK